MQLKHFLVQPATRALMAVIGRLTNKDLLATPVTQKQHAPLCEAGSPAR
jgi:hypothetical protein